MIWQRWVCRTDARHKVVPALTLQLLVDVSPLSERIPPRASSSALPPRRQREQTDRPILRVKWMETAQCLAHSFDKKRPVRYVQWLDGDWNRYQLVEVDGKYLRAKHHR